MITLYTAKDVPNGWKTIIILEALKVPYEVYYLDCANNEQYRDQYKKINPNSRVPSLQDGNNDNFVIWESNAINKYLADQYDKGYNMSFPRGSKEAYLVDQWLDFHGSGQLVQYQKVFRQMYWPHYAGYAEEACIEDSRRECIRQLRVVERALKARNISSATSPP